MIWLRLVPVAAALLCIVLGLVPWERSSIAHPVHTSGTVIGHRRQRGDQHRNEVELIAPVVRYDTPGGEVTAVSRQFLPEWQYRIHVGDTVQVCYDREQPDVFALQHTGGEWRRGILLTLGCGTLLAYGVLMIQYA